MLSCDNFSIIQGLSQEFGQGGGLNIFYKGKAQHPSGPENPLKSIDFTGQGGGLSPHSPPLNTTLEGTIVNHCCNSFNDGSSQLEQLKRAQKLITWRKLKFL